MRTGPNTGIVQLVGWLHLTRTSWGKAVTNASRHGNARRIDISYFCTPVDPNKPSSGIQFAMTVTDDGLGPASTVKPGLGLNSISAAGGLWELTAGRDSGAQLSILWPNYPE